LCPARGQAHATGDGEPLTDPNDAGKRFAGGDRRPGTCGYGTTARRHRDTRREHRRQPGSQPSRPTRAHASSMAPGPRARQAPASDAGVRSRLTLVVSTVLTAGGAYIAVSD